MILQMLLVVLLACVITAQPVAAPKPDNSWKDLGEEVADVLRDWGNEIAGGLEKAGEVVENASDKVADRFLDSWDKFVEEAGFGRVGLGYAG